MNRVFDFEKRKIVKVLQADEVAYTCGMLDKREIESHKCQLFMEVKIDQNADNLSLAIVDFDQGGKSSVTFSPDTGAVIRETKIQESPRKVAGSYIQPLMRNRESFEGKMAILIRHGLLCFYRQYWYREKDANGVTKKDGRITHYGPYECTGYCTDFSWAHSNYLTPCIAFRDTGAYHAEVLQFAVGDDVEKIVHLHSQEHNIKSLVNQVGGRTGIDVEVAHGLLKDRLQFPGKPPAEKPLDKKLGIRNHDDKTREHPLRNDWRLHVWEKLDWEAEPLPEDQAPNAAQREEIEAAAEAERQRLALAAQNGGNVVQQPVQEADGDVRMA